MAAFLEYPWSRCASVIQMPPTVTHQSNHADIHLVCPAALLQGPLMPRRPLLFFRSAFIIAHASFGLSSLTCLRGCAGYLPEAYLQDSGVLGGGQQFVQCGLCDQGG